MTDTLTTAASTSEGDQQGTTTTAPAGGAAPQQQQPATLLDGQPDGGQPSADGQGGDDGGNADAGAPEQYADFTMPEGVQLDEATLTEFKAVAKDFGLSQEKAQQFLDRMGPLSAQRTQALMEQARTDWAEQSKADTEFGGTKLTESLAAAAKARDAFGTAELRTLLNESGLGNHPEVIRLFVRVGKAISEDRVVTGGSGVQAPKSGAVSEADRAAILYPNMKK